MSSCQHLHFDSIYSRHSQSLCNESCQNILYKSVFEHITELRTVAAFVLASKSFQNSSLGANFAATFRIDENSIALLKNVLSPSSCLTLQFAPSLHIVNTVLNHQVDNDIADFVAELAQAKYFRLQLRSLSLGNVNVDVSNRLILAIFGKSASFPHLTSLGFRGSTVNENTMALICKSAPHLTNLSFVEVYGLSAAALHHISSLTAITSLELASSMVYDEDLEIVAKISTITSLKLTSAGEEITNASLRHVAKLTGITDLDLMGCSEISDSGLEHIASLPHISTLSLSCLRLMGDEGLEHISNMAGITSLNLSHNKYITDAGLAHVAKLGKLTSINLSGCGHQISEGKKNFGLARPGCRIIG